MSYTLSAKCTVDLIYLFIFLNAHCGSGTGTDHIPDIQTLHLVTDLYTAHTFDTFSGIPDQWEVVIPVIFFITLLKRKVNDIQVICQLLQGTVAASDTDRTFAVMLGQQKLYISLSCTPHLRTVGIDYHSFFYHVVAGSNHLFDSLYFHHTDTTGRDFVDSF